jgi:hypothetical protein
MAIIALEESQPFSWVARGWEAMSFFVCFLYAFKAAEKILSKSVEYVEVDETWDIALFVEGVGLDAQAFKLNG